MGARTELPAQLGQLFGVGLAIVDAVDHRPFETDPPVLDLEVLGAGIEQIVDRVPLVDGDQLVAQLVVGSMERHREVHREGKVLQGADSRHDPDGGDRDVASGQPDVTVDPLGGGPDAIEVGHRFAHPHEHDVAHPSPTRLCRAGGTDDLFDDLAGGEMPREAGLAGGAEPARHRAAGLAAHADGGAVGIQHQHGFDAASTVEFPQELDGVALVADRLGHEVERERELLVEARPQRFGEIGDVRRVGQLLVETGPDLVEPVPRFAVEERPELASAEVVSRRGHGGHANCSASVM